MNRWLQVTENRKEIAGLGGKIDPDRIQMETSDHIEGLQQLSNRVFSRFIDLFGIQKKYVRILSR